MWSAACQDSKISVGGGWIRLIVGFQPRMVIAPTANGIRWCMQMYAWWFNVDLSCLGRTMYARRQISGRLLGLLIYSRVRTKENASHEEICCLSLAFSIPNRVKLAIRTPQLILPYYLQLPKKRNCGKRYKWLNHIQVIMGWGGGESGL